MSSCVLIVKESCLKDVFDELQEQIVEHGLLVRIMEESEFNSMMNILKEDEYKEENDGQKLLYGKQRSKE